MKLAGRWTFRMQADCIPACRHTKRDVRQCLVFVCCAHVLLCEVDRA
jgi:hypothetical protein